MQSSATPLGSGYPRISRVPLTSRRFARRTPQAWAPACYGALAGEEPTREEGSAAGPRTPLGSQYQASLVPVLRPPVRRGNTTKGPVLHFKRERRETKRMRRISVSVKSWPPMWALGSFSCSWHAACPKP